MAPAPRTWVGGLLRWAWSFIFTIAFTAAAVYYLARRVVRVMVEHAVLCGLLYGELVFLFMYFVVLPVSALGPAHFSFATYITGPLGHTLLVGLPIALSVRRFAGVRADLMGLLRIRPSRSSFWLENHYFQKICRAQTRFQGVSEPRLVFNGVAQTIFLARSGIERKTTLDANLH